MVGSMQHHIEACICDRIPDLSGGIKIGKTGKTTGISPKNSFLIDDLHICGIQKRSDPIE